MFQLQNKFNKIKPGKIYRKNQDKFHARGKNNRIYVVEFEVKAAMIRNHNY